MPIYVYNMYKYTCYRYTCFVLWITYYISLTLQSTVAAVIVASWTSLSDADGDKKGKKVFSFRFYSNGMHARRSDSSQWSCER